MVGMVMVDVVYHKELCVSECSHKENECSITHYEYPLTHCRWAIKFFGPAATTSD